MTTRYKLPEWLGGHEVDVHGTRGDGQLIVTPRGIGPTGVNPTEIHIDRDELTEVKPPLPPEPPNGTVYSNGETAAIRRDDPEIDAEGRWYLTGDEFDYHRWEGGFGIADLISSASGWRRYIPDPADDAPVRQLIDAALAWVSYVQKASSPPSMWADTHDFKLIEAGDAYLAAREVETP